MQSLMSLPMRLPGGASFDGIDKRYPIIGGTLCSFSSLFERDQLVPIGACIKVPNELYKFKLIDHPSPSHPVVCERFFVTFDPHITAHSKVFLYMVHITDMHHQTKRTYFIKQGLHALRNELRDTELELTRSETLYHLAIEGVLSELSSVGVLSTNDILNSASNGGLDIGVLANDPRVRDYASDSDVDVGVLMSRLMDHLYLLGHPHDKHDATLRLHQMLLESVPDLDVLNRDFLIKKSTYGPLTGTDIMSVYQCGPQCVMSYGGDIVDYISANACYQDPFVYDATRMMDDVYGLIRSINSIPFTDFHIRWNLEEHNINLLEFVHGTVVKPTIEQYARNCIGPTTSIPFRHHNLVETVFKWAICIFMETVEDPSLAHANISYIEVVKSVFDEAVLYIGFGKSHSKSVKTLYLDLALLSVCTPAICTV